MLTVLKLSSAVCLHRSWWGDRNFSETPGKKMGGSAQSNRKRGTTLQFGYNPLLGGLIKH